MKFHLENSSYEMYYTPSAFGTMRKRAEIVFHAVFKNIIFVGVLFTDWEIQ